MNQRTVLAYLFFVGSSLSFGHDPTTPAPNEAEIARLQTSGEWEDAKRRLDWLKQYRIQNGVNARAFFKIETEAKLASGMSETEVARSYGDRAFPYLSQKPELKSHGDIKTLTLLVDFKNHKSSIELPGMTLDGIRSNIYGDEFGNSVPKSTFAFITIT